ncbi:hypothetical protein GCM10023310_27240 [Paenibacillus vulneris]|uniref:Alginate lyase domain-containing protein n=1 Tax=Paenibacillus vulneris TaxID=1133364 RepID=A0ABW3UT96_9BACL
MRQFINEVALLEQGAERVWDLGHPSDWRAFEAVGLEIWVPEGSVMELTLRVYPQRIGRPEYIPVTAATVHLTGNGWTEVETAFSQFDYKHAAPAFWRMIRKLGIEARTVNGGGEAEAGIRIRSIRLKSLGVIALSAERLSCSAQPGEEVQYELNVCNESNTQQAITLALEPYGYESMRTQLEPGSLVLEPGQTGRVTLQVTVHDGIAPGGYERLTVVAIPGGKAVWAKRLTLYTVRALAHPYIMHTEAGWEQVRRNAAAFPWAQKELDDYIRIAKDWVVPEAQGPGQPFAFELGQRFKLHAAGIAWKLTGRTDFLEKAVLFLRRLADPITGYPATDAPMLHIYSTREELELPSPRGVKVSTGGLIHEGELMLDIVSVYDLLYNESCWTGEDRSRLEHVFRLFIEKVDWMITDGDTNNIPSGGMAAALLCSLLLQDMHWIRRFIHGPGGFIDMVATGVMDDGWYFEGASNYVVLFADMMTRVVQACEPWGLGLKDRKIPPSYHSNAMLSPWSMPGEKPFLGMSFAKYGPANRNYRTIKDVWDAMLPFIDDRGVLFGANDSTAKQMGKWYDLAYYVWRDPRYAAVIRSGKGRDLVYGAGELPVGEDRHDERSVIADNVGLALLRSGGQGSASSRIQAVLKYGSHGGYHGHFDRTGLLGLIRYGKNAYSPLASWYGYHSFMFKMWVQASMSHNMVVVDQRMQEPAPSKRLLFHSGTLLNVCAVETVARWCAPPYGGQTPYPEAFPQERGLIEGREVPIPPQPRPQGDTGTYSEPVVQRRLVAVTEDYVVIADYLKGEEPHTFDCLHHYQGFQGIDGARKRLLRHTAQMSEDPYGSAQFITDCSWYECDAPARIRFSHSYNAVRDDSEGRNNMHNEEGLMNLHLHTLWPPQQELMTGWYAEAAPVNKVLSYEIAGDGVQLAEGQFGAWILGKRSLDIPLQGIRELKLQVRVDRSSRKTVFWGNPCVLLQDGRRLPLTDLPIRYENVDPGHGVGSDYYGGQVHLAGELYREALPFEPLDPSLPAVAVIDLSGLEAMAFQGTLGGDYPLGDDPARRKTISIRTSGREAYFITLLEPHEGDSVIAAANAISPELIRVQLTDGRTQVIDVHGLKGDGRQLHVRLRELGEAGLLREECTN